MKSQTESARWLQSLGLKGTRALWTVCVAVLLLGTLVSPVSAQSSSGRQSGRAKQKAAELEYDRATLVILAPLGPVTADLRISVGRQPYRRWIGTFLAKKLDTDGNQMLTVTELGGVTGRLLGMLQVNSPRQIVTAVSGNAEATEIGNREFAAWVRNSLPASFFVRAEPRAPEEAVRVTQLIDEDGDGAVSLEELAEANHLLRFRDLDDDETFSVTELIPFRDPRTQDASLSTETANLPFLEVVDAESAIRAANMLVSRYGNGTTIPAASLRLPEAQLRKAVSGLPEQSGAVGDSAAVEGSLPNEISVEQLVRYLKSDVQHLVFNVQLSDQANLSRIEVIPADNTDFVEVSSDDKSTARVLFDRLPLTIVARGGGANSRAYAEGFLGQNFIMSDGDKNQYLSEAEFGAFSSSLSRAGVQADFATVDQDHDGMVTRNEVFGFAARDMIATASRIEVSVRQEGRTLFSMLDENGDRRLTQREIRSGELRLKEADLNQDNKFADTELGTEYTLTIGLGQSDLRREVRSGAMQMQGRMQNPDAIVPETSMLSGPEWFRRMDRNRDGDVSPREFIGTTNAFQKVDQNSDGLISAEEAAAQSPP